MILINFTKKGDLKIKRGSLKKLNKQIRKGRRSFNINLEEIPLWVQEKQEEWKAEGKTDQEIREHFNINLEDLQNHDENTNTARAF
jgi:hypothetical protein